jgi:CelD/BcsL family acetyltransferase involved in cellulose biosynthesis
MRLRIRRIERPRDFMALAAVWSELMLVSGQTSPFLSYDWFWCCWHGVWPHRRPEVLVIEDTSSALAIIPLMHWRGRLYGLPVRWVCLLEYGNTPMIDMLSVGEHDRVMETLIDHLAGRSDWDIACFQRLPATSPTVKALERVPAERLACRRVGKIFSPYLSIGEEWKCFYDRQSLAVRKRHDALWAELERTGDPSIEEHRTVDLWSPLFQETVSFICRSSINAGMTDNDTPSRLPEFSRELTRRATKNGWLSIWLLKLSGRVIAMQYQLHAAGRVQVLWEDQDPAYTAWLPDRILKLAVLQSLFACGWAHEYRTVPRPINDRFWWVTGWHELVRFKLYRPSFYSNLLRRIDTLIIPETRS